MGGGPEQWPRGLEKDERSWKHYQMWLFAAASPAVAENRVRFAPCLCCVCSIFVLYSVDSGGGRTCGRTSWLGRHRARSEEICARLRARDAMWRCRCRHRPKTCEMGRKINVAPKSYTCMMHLCGEIGDWRQRMDGPLLKWITLLVRGGKRPFGGHTWSNDTSY